jgi:glycerol-3-phosphate dehydrogenase (NAD(P)+)
VTARVAVIGAGSWGTAVAALAARNGPTVLWARNAEVAGQIATDHVNGRYLDGFTLPESLMATASLEEALSGATLVVMGVPSHGFRDVLAEGSGWIGDGAPIVSLSKGVEQGSLKRMTEIIEEVLPGHVRGVLTGPNLAKEVLAGHPAATVVAMTDPAISEQLQPVFASTSFRVYTNTDVVGCEVAGALKNVMALAAGMADGMGMGDNTKAALMTRGLAELARLGVALGGRPLTFGGLAGIGDLIATCMSRQSRNRYVGEQLGQGRLLDDIVAEMNMVAEGVKTSRAVVELAARTGVDMPIAQEVAAVVNGEKTAAQIVASLLSREAGDELYGIRG